ncbi:MAG TPA: DMT family transporter [Anaerolineales bacterium]|nr:DMT family transporter [Anaerolineales bacterium]
MKFFGAILGLTAAAIWGGMYVVSDVVLEVIPPFTLLTIRLLLGITSLAFLATLVSRRSPTLPHAHTPLLPRSLTPLLLFTGFVGYGLSLGFQFWGTKLSTAANGALITSASPAFVALFAYFILRERITPARVAALALATLGVVVVVFDPEDVRLGADVLWGNLGLFGAAVTWGLYSVLVKRATTQGIPTLTVTVMAPAGGLFVAVPLMLWELTLGGEPIGAITPTVILGTLFLGIVCTALAVYFWNKAFELLDATPASLLFFAQPVVGAALSAWLLKEPLGVQFFLGGGMIAVGVLVVSISARNV